MNIKLKKYGATEELLNLSENQNDFYLARVTEQHHTMYKVVTELAEIHAQVSGKFVHQIIDETEYPVVGDWVLIDRNESTHDVAIIHQVFMRKNVIARVAAGTVPIKQIIGVHIDIVCICMALNNDFNLRRLERYLSLVWDSGAKPVIILTKSDLATDLSIQMLEVESIAIDVEIFIVTQEDISSIERIRSIFHEGITATFIGSSGVGKSSIINYLMGEQILAVDGLRNDDKGRHTTTHRQLMLLPSGGVVIDTPGMRELQLDAGDLATTFQDIELLAKSCKFNDCSHTREPGCAITDAIAIGQIDESRLKNYRKLQREVLYQDKKSKQAEQIKIKNMFGSKKEMKQARKNMGKR